MRPSALTTSTPETHLAQEKIAVARVGEALVLHDPRDTAVATLDDDDVPLAQVAPAYLIGRDCLHTVSRHPVSALTLVPVLFYNASERKRIKVEGPMFETANNDRAWAGSDDIELRPFEGGNARPLPDANQYVGLPNLVELAAATYLELRRESAEFNAAAKEREFKSQAERNAARRQCYAILGRICSLERDVTAMQSAMDDATRAEFDQAIAAMPALEELVA